jgi:hypothetical protein
MLSGVSPGRCDHLGCRQSGSMTVVTYPGADEHPVCDSHQEQAKTIAAQYQAVAYRIVAARPILILG